MNNRDRVLITLDHDEPDRVPITELSIDPPHIEKILGVSFESETSLQTQVSSDRALENAKINLTYRCYVKLGFEVIPCSLSAPDGWRAKVNPDGTMIDEWGRVLAYDSNSKSWTPIRGIFNSKEDFEEFTFPDPNAPGRTYGLERMSKLIRGGEALLAAFVRDPFAHAWEMFQPTNFTLWLYTDPVFIKRVIDMITQFNVEVIKRAVDAGAELIISGGDYCEKRGPMIPVKYFREIVFPNLKKQVEAAHRKGVKFIKHTDGNINPILGDLHEIVDGLHSLDPSAGVDIGLVKEKYGDKLVLIGNVSVDGLCRKSREEVIEETKNCIKRAAPGGGYILSSSNSWYANAKLENCLAMIETGRKYGKYPISIP